MNGPTERAREALRRWAVGTPGCRLLVLFGSRATERATEGADLDLAVQFETLPSAERRLRIIGDLQALGGDRRVDVVFLRPETDPVLRFEIFRDGIPLYECREGVFVEERVRAVKLYDDALPFRRALRRRLAAGGGA